ncbi:hypothetical protein EDB80DRAFT_893804 [Ilyonectria destructans]|nr:hypothetical protein EDB80DRAFT_893804 [Ilyonectria destructans]
MTAGNSVSLERAGAFYRLPNELLITIVKSCEGLDNPVPARRKRWWHGSYRLLETLRLTHPRFANLKFINTLLFTTIQLEPTRAGLRSLQRGDFSRVAEFVLRITFVTPPNWALSFEAFSDIVSRLAVEAHADEIDEEEFRRSYWVFDKPEQERYVNEHLGGEWPLSEAQLRDGFAAYSQEAAATKALLEGPDAQLKDAWVSLMRKLGSRPLYVRFINVDCGQMRRPDYYYDSPCNSDPKPPCSLAAHEHTGEPEVHCTRPAAVAGDSLFAMAMSCLAISGVSVGNMVIQHYMTGSFAWETITAWESLDLSSLKVFNFSPRILLGEAPGENDSAFAPLPLLTAEDVGQRASEAVHTVLDKSHNSLTCLRINVERPMRWPGRRVTLDLPALRDVHIMNGDVNAPLLRRWMAHMPQLHLLEIADCQLFKGLPSEWIKVLDAIRDHPNVAGPMLKGLTVKLNPILTTKHTGVHYNRIVRRGDDIIATKGLNTAGTYEAEDSAKAFERHFYNAVPFRKNYVLRYWLDCYTPDTGSDEYDEEPEDNDEDETREGGEELR